MYDVYTDGMMTLKFECERWVNKNIQRFDAREYEWYIALELETFGLRGHSNSNSNSTATLIKRVMQRKPIGFDFTRLWDF